ncbi:MAG: hypothetical protein IKO84_08850 [Butyrivibrio sp.]|nr:hypothetical protein [Butyrivibrio sp.]
MGNEKLYCKICGQTVNENQKFCTNCGAPVEHDASSAKNENAQQNDHAQDNINAQQGARPISNENAAQSSYIPLQNTGAPQNPNMGMNPNMGRPQNPNYGMPQNPNMGVNPNIPPYVAPPKKENKVLVAVLLGILALSVILGLVSTVRNIYKSVNGGTYNSAFKEKEEEESDTYTTVGEEDDDSKDASDENGANAKYAAEEYNGPYDYLNGEWVVPVESAFVSSSGYVNSEYLGESMLIAQTTDLSRGMVLVDNGFRFINSDASDINFAPEARCADISPKGNSIFYVVSTEARDGYEIGKLYILDTDNGKTELIAENVVSDSPVISPSGKYVAYLKDMGGENFNLFIGGKDVKEELVDIELSYPICVSDDKTMFFTHEADRSVIAYDGALCYPIFKDPDIKSTFINTDCKEILISGTKGTYYYKFNHDEEEKKITDSEIKGIITDCLSQPYGQIANTTFCDVTSLQNILYIADDQSIFAINPNKYGVTMLPHSFSDLTNIIMKGEGENRKVLYSYGGILYQFVFDDEKSLESVFYEDKKVDSFVSSFDLKKIWIISDGELYYLEKDKATLVASDIPSNVDPLGDGIMWNVEDNWLYYLKDGKLYRVNTTEDSNQVVSKDADVLTNVYGKLYYLPKARDSVYLFMNGEFKEVL